VIDPDDPLPCAGERVVLRRLRATDLASFQAYRHDPDLGRYQGWSPTTDDAARAFLEEMGAVPLFRPGEWAQIGIAEPATDALLGDIGLHLATDGRAVEIGFTLARAAQGQGVATAAVRAALQLVFRATAVERVVGVTDVRNRASIGVLERVGMRHLETRDAVFRGEACVELVYAKARVTA
jgi:aminoglycoside 6'-N-acetyltransferase